MNFKDGLNVLVEDFYKGKKAISFSYSPTTGMFYFLSIHEIYEWDGEKDPVYISFDSQNKIIYVDNAVYSDFNDETLTTFMGVSTDFLEILDG